jgi:hypothetical protein
MSELAKANTIAGKAAFWRNSFNQGFMAKGSLVALDPVLAVSSITFILWRVALSVEHPLSFVNGTKGPKRFSPWSDGYIFRPIYDRRMRCYLQGQKRQFYSTHDDYGH